MLQNKNTSNFILAISLILFSLFYVACNLKSKNYLESEIWENFKSKIENKDLSFLESNSFTTLKCADCVQMENAETYSSQLIFEKHINKLYDKKLIQKMNYTIYQSDSIIRIRYRFEKLFNKMESSEIIYLFDKKGDKYLFSGMIKIP